MLNLELIQGDITEIQITAIVNAANSSLLGGGGVDGAIHRKGGSAILDACMEIRNRQGGCKVGEAVITTAGKLPSNYVIHTVGPFWQGGQNNEPELLRNCYLNSLKLASEHDIRELAFPNISTGIYRFPKARAAQIAVQAVKDFGASSNAIDRVLFVCFDPENYRLYERLLGGESS